jgi:hypothetical protein
MAQTVFVSRLAEAMQARGLGVSELRRRLEQRGYRVSRAALDRLVSDRPVHEVTLDILVPVLEELRVDLASAFERVDAAQARARLSTRAAARRAVRDLPTGRSPTGDRRARVAAANAELDAVSDRMEAALRARRPELFDRRGRLRRRALTELLVERAGKRELTQADVIALAEQIGRPAPAPHDG